jgi:hypothetical protein
MRALPVALAVVVLVAGAGFWPESSDVRASDAATKTTSPYLPTPPLAPPRTTVFFAHARSLARKPGRWELRIDPAEFLAGVTANRAAAEDGVVAPGEPVPNDYYIRDDGHRLLTYLVAPTARVTVITQGIRATRISLAELSQILRGRNPARRRLYAPDNGFWIRATGDIVRSLDQQYTP